MGACLPHAKPSPLSLQPEGYLEIAPCGRISPITCAQKVGGCVKALPKLQDHIVAMTSQGTVTVHALEAGYLTLPERFFVTPMDDPDARKTVPSLSFLIQHSSPAGKTTRLVFDLGMRRDLSLYPPVIQKHVSTRHPLKTDPDVVKSLAKGGLNPDDIDYIVLSHVHWDHIGLPSDFQTSTFIVGNGSCGLLSGKIKLSGSHSHFEADLLPKDRTIELPDSTRPTPSLQSDEEQVQHSTQDGLLDLARWRSFSMFPAAIDVFSDGSMFIVSAPGHLPGHLNALCRISVDPDKYVLLAGDACHDRRLLTGEKAIAEWPDPDTPGNICCIHVDKEVAKQTLQRISEAESGENEDLGKVEVIFAHDPVWDEHAQRSGRYWPGKL